MQSWCRRPKHRITQHKCSCVRKSVRVGRAKEETQSDQGKDEEEQEEEEEGKGGLINTAYNVLREELHWLAVESAHT